MEARQKSSGKDILGKRSAWGEREQDLFNIQIEKEVIVVYELIEPKWFHFTTWSNLKDCILHLVCNPNE